MSGIYIKGMEMPTGCAFCKIKRRNGKKMVCPFVNEQWDIHDPMSADLRLNDCPLVPVPDHGRLIDADALLATERETFEDYHIEDAPTIIPAEEETGE